MKSTKEKKKKEMQDVLNRETLDNCFNKCLKKAINNTQQLVKGEISDEELDVEQGLQQVSVGKMVENFTKILLDNEKVDHADMNVQMRLKNVRIARKQNVRFIAYESVGLDERGGRIIRA
ncbi:Translation initiation factor [Dirofilaria immitis]